MPVFQIYIDKSMLISKTDAVYRTERKFIYVSRPRRFGKSMAANMLTAYYSCGCDSSELFAGLMVASKCGLSPILYAALAVEIMLLC